MTKFSSQSEGEVSKQEGRDDEERDPSFDDQERQKRALGSTHLQMHVQRCIIILMHHTETVAMDKDTKSLYRRKSHRAGTS